MQITYQITNRISETIRPSIGDMSHVRISITPSARVLHWTSADPSPTSPTVGMSVILHRRPTTPDERAWYARWQAAIARLSRLASAGLEPARKGRGGLLGRIEDAWLAARPVSGPSAS